MSRWTGSVGVAWNVWQKYLIFDGVVRYVGAAPDGQRSAQYPAIDPAHTLVDVGIGGELDRYYWSLKVQNLFNVHYFEYAICASIP